jgi:hypothetical protein
MPKNTNARGKGALSAAKRAADRAAAALRQGKRNASDEESDELDPRTADRKKRKDKKKVADEEEEEEEEEEEAEEEDDGDIEGNEDEETQTVDSTAAGQPKKRVTFNYFILPLLVVMFRCEQKRAPSVTVEIEKGPFAIFDLRPNATNLQRFIVPWLIARYGLSYPKTMETHVLKEMLIATIDQNKLLGPYDSCAEQSKIYAVAFQDLVKKVKNTAGLSFIMLCCTSASS